MDDITEESLWPSPTPAISHNATSVSLAQRTSFFERLLSPVTKRFDSIKASSPFASPNTLEQHLALKTPKNVGQIGQFLTFNEDIEVEFTQIIMKCKRRRLGAGEISIPAGCTERKFVFVVIGSLRSEILTRHGVSVFNPLLGVHEIVGVVPFILEETPSHADFVTNQVSELCYVDFEEVQRHFDSVNKLSLLFHYLSIELSKNVIHVLGRVKRKKRHDKAKAKMGKFVSLSSFSLEQTDVQASNAGRSFSKRFGSLSISFKDGDRRDSNSKELILKATHLSSRIQIPESEDVITSCNCKISCTSGSVGGLGVLKLTQNYFIFQHKSMLGRSAIIRLDNLTEPGDHSPFPAQALKMKVLLDHTFCVVTRRHPRVNTSRISLEISDSSGRNFVALMRDLLKFQVTANKAAETLRMKVEGESKEAGFSSTTTPRLPLLDLFLSSEGSSTLLVYRPGESVVSRESALRRLCVVWQGAGVGTFHGRVVRRVEFGDLLFLEDFLAQGRATQDHITAALDCQQVFGTSILIYSRA
jgi:CRP-like cAMP-binding protein